MNSLKQILNQYFQSSGTEVQKVFPQIFSSFALPLAQPFVQLTPKLDMAKSGVNTTMMGVAAAVADSCAAAAEEDEGNCYNPYQAKILSIVSIFVILVASAFGVFLPLFGKKFLKGCQPGSFVFIVGERWERLFSLPF